MKVLIIEDELHAQKDLIRLLKITHDDIDVLECIDTVEDSVHWLQNNPAPELIFMDIQLSDGLSFEIFQQIEVESPIIFTTAFDEYAIQAFKFNSIDYLLKPIDKEQLANSISKFNKLHSSNKVNALLKQEQVQQLLELTKVGKEYKKRFITKTGDKIRHISVEDISYFFSEQDYTYLVTKEKNKFILDYTLDELMNVLDPDDFFRLSRKYIAKIHSIAQVNKYFNSRLEVELTPPADDQILISRIRVPEFLKWLEK